MAIFEKTIDVAVAVVINANNEVLISFRHASLHQGNLWEFPGGKIGPGESVQAALHRELKEELDLDVLQSFPVKTISYKYPDKSVKLHVRRVTAWEGLARGLEGQAIDWKPIAKLDPNKFPAANAPIVKLLKLPPLIAITPQLTALNELESLVRELLDQGLSCIQLRQPQLSHADYLEWFKLGNKLCQARHATLMFNGEVSGFESSGASGYHANSARLRCLQERPVAQIALFSASCHNIEELILAAALDADFVTLSPIANTAKYPAGTALGWRNFAALVQQASMPVYALGGMVREDLPMARQYGAHGISGIGMFLG